jgi:hypothetical protein
MSPSTDRCAQKYSERAPARVARALVAAGDVQSNDGWLTRKKTAREQSACWDESRRMSGALNVLLVIPLLRR